MKIIILILFMTICLLSDSVSAHIIDDNEKRCIANTADTQTMNKCSQIAQKAWEKEIKKNLLRLKSIMAAKDYKHLLSAQKEWEIYNAKESILINDVNNSVAGTMYSNVRQGFKTELLKQRALRLQEYLEIYNNN